MSAAVDARKETVVPLKIDCDLCGFVQIQIQKSKVTDYFRLLSSTKSLDIRKEISVLPEAFAGSRGGCIKLSIFLR